MFAVSRLAPQRSCFPVDCETGSFTLEFSLARSAKCMTLRGRKQLAVPREDLLRALISEIEPEQCRFSQPIDANSSASLRVGSRPGTPFDSSRSSGICDSNVSRWRVWMVFESWLIVPERVQIRVII